MSKTMEKCCTNLEEFNYEIISYNLSYFPNFEQEKSVLEKPFTEKHYESINMLLFINFLRIWGINHHWHGKSINSDNGYNGARFVVDKTS